MKLNKSELSLIKKISKKISKADNSADETVMKKYVFKISAAHVVRNAEITAASKKEAEEIMWERYGDLPYELIDVH